MIIYVLQLSSVPVLEQDQSTKSVIKNKDSKDEEESTPKIDEPDNSKADEPEDTQAEKQPVSKDPRYEKYFKMVHFGVPKEAVKLKMEQEGLDSSILE